MSGAELLGPRLAVNLNLHGRWRLQWILLTPVRWYLQYSPIKKGKAFLRRRVYVPMLPRRLDLSVRLPGGPTLDFGHTDRIGVRLALHGRFEGAELECLTRAAVPGSVCIDVGANVGFYTLALATAVGPNGRVIAVEPLSRNAARLAAHVRRNNLSNVIILQVAIGSETGVAEVDCAGDPAFATTKLVADPSSASGFTVQQRPLDDVWSEAGRPRVSVVKIDVEGAEADVISGSRALLTTARPLVLCEANSPEALEALDAQMSPLGFERSQPVGFEPWNYLYRFIEGRPASP